MAALWAWRLGLGAGLAAAVAWAGRRAGALNGRGALGAAGVGALAFAGGGLAAGAVLLFFFVTGSLLSALRRRHQGRTARPRSERQVVANGLPAAVGGLWQLVAGPHPAWQALLVGSVAAMTADTWATEVGLWSRGPTWSVRDGRRVTPGTSGAVSVAGTAAGVAGAALAAGLALWATRASVGIPWLASPGVDAAVVLAAGLAGMAADSLLGGFVQGHYRCQSCGRRVEDPGSHCAGACPGHCPAPAPVLAGGVAWVDNDVVNAVAAWAA
ncbi:MAG TPA: DUF92 domain-containing protein, partial [Limnochordales bacterium]